MRDIRAVVDRMARRLFRPYTPTQSDQEESQSREIEPPDAQNEESESVAKKRPGLKNVSEQRAFILTSPDAHMGRTKGAALALAAQLFAGYSAQALPELVALCKNPDISRHARAGAAWALARWYALSREPLVALEYLYILRRSSPKESFILRICLLEIECLLRAGRPHEALATALDYGALLGTHAALELFIANCFAELGRGTEQMAFINKSLQRGQFTPIKTTTEKPSFFGIFSQVEAVESPAKISVLMPVYNGSNVVGVALKGLLTQSWTNIEIVVVDDASSDETWTVIGNYARQDSRVVPFRHSTNRGAYAARNSALGLATGEFVTVHDADDWSHPQRLEAQVRELKRRPSIFGNMTFAVKTSASLQVRLKLESAGVFSLNSSSLLVRREALISAGGWDEVKVSADSELIARLGRRFGKAADQIYKDRPLAFLLASEASLTAAGPTSLASLRFGARREYLEAYEHWHRVVGARGGRPRLTPGQRPFPVPDLLLRGGNADFGTILVSDFSEVQSAIAAIEALPGGLPAQRTGFIHLPARGNVTRKIGPRVRALLLEKSAVPVVPGDVARCSRLIIATDQPHAPDRLPVITAGEVVFRQPGNPQAPDWLSRLLASPPYPAVASNS